MTDETPNDSRVAIVTGAAGALGHRDVRALRA